MGTLQNQPINQKLKKEKRKKEKQTKKSFQ